MQQRRLRLGDILDDYCPRERRITNHVVVAMIEEAVKQTRCTTCDADHEYKEAKVPAARRRKAGALASEDLDAGARPRPVTVDAEETVSIEEPLDGTETFDEPQPIEAAAPAAVADVPDGDADPESPADDGDRDEWPVHRPLIRAHVAAPEGQAPERKATGLHRPPGRQRRPVRCAAQQRPAQPRSPSDATAVRDRGSRQDRRVSGAPARDLARARGTAPARAAPGTGRDQTLHGPASRRQSPAGWRQRQAGAGTGPRPPPRRRRPQAWTLTRPLVTFAGKHGLIVGVANKRSIAWAIAQATARRGARLAHHLPGPVRRTRQRAVAGTAKPAARPAMRCVVGRRHRRGVRAHRAGVRRSRFRGPWRGVRPARGTVGAILEHVARRLPDRARYLGVFADRA